MKNRIILILVLVSFFGFGQKIKYLEIKDKHNTEIVTDIQFIDTISNSIIKTVSLQQENPYNNIDISEKTTFNDAYTAYKLDSNKVKEYINKFGTKDLIDAKYLVVRQVVAEKLKGSFENKTVTIIFQKYLSDGYDGIFMNTLSTTVYVYDNMGNKIFSLENINTDCTSPIVSNNGKYFAYFYGDALCESCESQEKGIKIINILTGKVEYNFKDNALSEGIYNNKNLILFSKYDKLANKAYIFNSETKQLYVEKAEQQLYFHILNENEIKLFDKNNGYNIVPFSYVFKKIDNYEK